MNLGSMKMSLVKAPFRFIRALISKNKFFDYPSVNIFSKGSNGKMFSHEKGYQSRLEQYRNKYKGQRCFIIGNGPSLKKMDLSCLKDEITMGSNGIFKMFDELGFNTDFIFFEDREQTYLRRKEINALEGVTKLVSLTNSYFIKSSKDTLFFNERLGSRFEENKYAPRFSYDFASVGFVGGSVTYLMLEWAYYLGFTEVVVIGVDHNYGELPKLFPPGKIKITEETLEKVKGLHFNDGYYKVGDVIGVPHVEFQDASYAHANDVFLKGNRKVVNAGLDSKLKAFDSVIFQDLFK